MSRKRGWGVDFTLLFPEYEKLFDKNALFHVLFLEKEKQYMARNFKIPPHKSTNLVTTQADIGLMIKAMRNKQSIRIDDAAALCGVSVSLLSALERNSGRSVSVDKVLNILDQLGLALVITDKSKARDILSGIDEALV